MISLGIIGISDGNGHPYSWSAICNGYSPVDMATCGFPVIPEYLSEQTWPRARLPDVEVSHVWTQDPAISNKIAKATLIPNIVKTPQELLLVTLIRRLFLAMKQKAFGRCRASRTMV